MLKRRSLPFLNSSPTNLPTIQSASPSTGCPSRAGSRQRWIRGLRRRATPLRVGWRRRVDQVTSASTATAWCLTPKVRVLLLATLWQHTITRQPAVARVPGRRRQPVWREESQEGERAANNNAAGCSWPRAPRPRRRRRRQRRPLRCWRQNAPSTRHHHRRLLMGGGSPASPTTAGTTGAGVGQGEGGAKA